MFFLANNGTLPLTVSGRTSFGITVSTTNGALTLLEACSGTWNETANTCSGATNLLISGAASYTFPANTTFAVGQSIRLRLTPVTVMAGSSVTLGAWARR